VLYHKPAQQALKLDLAKREKDLEELKKAHNIPDKQD